MGREVRRVPAGFQHPRVRRRDRDGTTTMAYRPCHDRTFREATEEYDANRRLWEAGTHPDQQQDRDTPERYDDWAGPRPDKRCHLPDDFDRENATGWCLYENVTEGTPITPVFGTADELIDHLATVGTAFGEQPTREQAEALVRSGRAPSGTVTATGFQDPFQTALQEGVEHDKPA